MVKIYCTILDHYPSDKYKNNEYEIIFVGYGIFSED